ncbi:hypothetical protein AAC387_Pa07g3382 [Persea americana]
MGETGKRSRPQRDSENKDRYHKRRANNRDNSDDEKYQKRRGNDRDDTNDDKYQKRRNHNKDEGELIVYRILCRDSVIGCVIGKNGKVINSLRQETWARIKVVDPFPGANERVITIYCYVKDKDKKEVHEDETEPLCAAQDALLKVHSTIATAVDNFFQSDKEYKAEVRILVPTSQVANVIGKSGNTIKKLRAKTGANIKVTRKDPNDPTHSFAMSFDNIVQITGDAENVNKALFAVSAIMYKFPPKEEISLDATVPELSPSIIIPADVPIYPTGGLYAGADAMVPPTGSIPPVVPAPHISELHSYTDAGTAWPVYTSALPAVPAYSGPSRSEELVIQLLCPSDRLGRVIGRGGSSIKSVRQESGARVDVGDPRADSEQCVITVTSTESADDLKSNAVEAVLLLQGKINDNDDNNSVNFRMLVPTKAIGCLIGKGGSIINEMRKSTKADVRISKGKKPKCARDDDQLIEVIGEVGSVRDALVQIVLRLRDFVLRDRDGPRGASPTDSLFPGARTTTPATDSLFSGSSRGLSVPSTFSSIPPVAPLSYEQRVEAGSGMGMLPSSSLYRYGSLQVGENGYGSSYGSLSPYSSRSYGGLSSILEIVIPGNAVGKVMGKGGSNLTNIQKISGAVVEIRDSKSSRSERVAQISGTPEQRRTAENLVRAFILAT